MKHNTVNYILKEHWLFQDSSTSTAGFDSVDGVNVAGSSAKNVEHDPVGSRTISEGIHLGHPLYLKVPFFPDRRNNSATQMT